MARNIKKLAVLSVAIVFVGSSLVTAGGITTFQRPKAQTGRYKSRTHATSPAAKMQWNNSTIVDDVPTTPADEAPKTKATSKSAKTGNAPATGATGKTAMKAAAANSR
jgi:hypothetical protein